MKNKDFPYTFSGPFKEYCHKYIDYKRSLGFKMSSSSFYVISGMDNFFKGYIQDTDSLVLTKDMVESYVALRGSESSKTQHSRMSSIRQFALFMNRIGFDFFVYPVTDLVKVTSNFIPFIFSYDEMIQLIKIVDNLVYSPQRTTYHLIYPMLLRMLYCCGLRINEALGLKMKNIDLQLGVIRIDESKSYGERLIPISSSLQKYCIKYISQMEFSATYEGYFYPSRGGNQYNSTPVYLQFKKFMKAANIFREDGSPPRVHDIRHTFAVHALEKMISEGQDIYCALPILSTYLGHKGIESTEKYLRLTEESYSSLINNMSQIYQGIFPEVISL